MIIDINAMAFIGNMMKIVIADNAAALLRDFSIVNIKRATIELVIFHHIKYFIVFDNMIITALNANSEMRTIMNFIVCYAITHTIKVHGRNLRALIPSKVVNMIILNNIICFAKLL